MKHFLFVLMGLTLLSCSAPYLGVQKMASCYKGDQLSKYATEDDYGSFDVEYKESFKLDGIPDAGNIDILVYKTFMLETNRFALIIPAPFTWKVTTYSVLAFEDGKLIFWGFPEEFLKNDDEKIRNIGAKASELIKQNIL